MTEEKNDKMVPGDLGALIPGFLGLGANIGMAIPGLRKPERTNAAEGAILAATTGAQRAAAAAGSAGYGATRGLSTREAGRQAQQVLLSAAPSIIQAASADEARYQQDLQARNQRLAQFGAQLGGSLSTLGAGIGQFVQDQREDAGQGYAPTGYEGQQVQQPVEAGPPGMVMDVPGTPQPAAAPTAAAPAPQQAAPAEAAPTPQAPAPVAAAQYPDLSAKGAASQAALVNDIAQREGLDPVMAAAHIDRYWNDPFANPIARLSPYRKGY